MKPFIGRPISSACPPLGLLYIGAILEQESYDVKIFDADALQWDFIRLQKLLEVEKPEVIGITITSVQFTSARVLAKICKEVLPNVKVIIGGPPPTIFYKEILEKNSSFDIAVIGEGEITVRELLQKLEKKEPLDSIRGIAFREKGKIIFTGFREPIKDVDTIPFPARNLLEPKIHQYKGIFPIFKKPMTSILMSRGCPHQCVFCSNPVFGRQATRFRSPINIVKELLILKDNYKIKSIFIYDDELVGMSKYQTKWLIEICDNIIDYGLDDINYYCQGRCSNFITFELLKKMKKAGFDLIMYGVESGSQKVLNAIKKGTTIQNIKNTFSLTKAAGIKTHAFIMVGNLLEEPEDIMLTVKLLKEINPDYLQVSIATPFPGSELWNIANSRGWINIQNNFPASYKKERAYAYSDFSPLIKTDWLSSNEIRYYKNYINIKYYQHHKWQLIKKIMTYEGVKSLPIYIKDIYLNFCHKIKIKN